MNGSVIMQRIDLNLRLVLYLFVCVCQLVQKYLKQSKVFQAVNETSIALNHQLDSLRIWAI